MARLTAAGLNSKLYLSGIEMFDIKRFTICERISKLYLSGIEIYGTPLLHILTGYSKLYLSGIEMSLRRLYSSARNSPNCTLVELKCDHINRIFEFSIPSKLYLSGIEILNLKIWKERHDDTPNCTLVELKF